jgi:hypothetical protein
MSAIDQEENMHASFDFVASLILIYLSCYSVEYLFVVWLDLSLANKIVALANKGR